MFPSTIELTFADGLQGLLEIGLLEMPVDRFHWSTVEASASGDGIVVTGINGDLVPIDVPTVRRPEIAAVSKLHVIEQGRQIGEEFSNRPPLLVFRREDVERFQKPKKTGRPRAARSKQKGTINGK